jgi:predicted PurR-regulated permease PerM
MNQKKDRWIQFLGGKNLLFSIAILCLLAVMIFLFHAISFFFKPFWVIFSALLPPVLFGIIIFYLVNPIVKRLEHKIPRIWVISGLYVIFIALLILATLQFIPMIQNQAEELIKQFPSFWNDSLATIQQTVAKTPLADEVNRATQSLENIWDKVSDFAGDYLQKGVQGIGSVFSVVSTTFLTLFTGPIIAFFLLKDKEKFYRFISKMIPPIWREDFNEYSQIVNTQIGDYLKGQVIASIVLGVLYWPAFLLIGLQFSGILALAAGILCIVPYIGPFVAFIPGLIIAFQASTFMVIKFVIVWFAIQLFHGDFIIPRVMGDRLKVHPITILLVILVMGELLGLMGVIFGIPLYCLIKVTVTYLFRKFKQRYNRFYGAQGQYEDTSFTKEDYLKQNNED